MTLIIVPSMYLIAERLRRPMRRMYGGKWISIMGIPPLTLLFIPLMIITSVKHRFEVARRRRKADDKTTTKHLLEAGFNSAVHKN